MIEVDVLHMAGHVGGIVPRRHRAETKDWHAQLQRLVYGSFRFAAPLDRPALPLFDFPPSITKLRVRLSMGSTTFAIWSSQTVQTRAFRSAVKATHGVSLRAFPEPLAWVSMPHVAFQNSCVLRVTLSLALTQASRSMPCPGLGPRPMVLILNRN